MFRLRWRQQQHRLTRPNHIMCRLRCTTWCCLPVTESNSKKKRVNQYYPRHHSQLPTIYSNPRLQSISLQQQLLLASMGPVVNFGRLLQQLLGGERAQTTASTRGAQALPGHSVLPGTAVCCQQPAGSVCCWPSDTSLCSAIWQTV